MAGTFDDYIIREHPDYRLQLGELGAAEGIRLEYFRKALNPTFRVLKDAPTSFPIIPSNAEITVRFARTDLYISEDTIVPPLQITFVIWEDEKVIDLLSIQKRPGFGLND
jgi:hypothetical protein